MNLKHPFAFLVSSLLIAAASCNSRPPLMVDSPERVAPTTLPTTAPTTAPSSPEARAMKETVDYLASDELEGRGIETNGINLAASFIAGNFHGMELKSPPGMTDYFQRFELVTTEGIAPETTLAINGKPLRLKDDFNPLTISAEGTFDAPAVFVGYGITSAEHNYDDYAGVDVKGKIAVAWRFEPADKDGKSKFGKGDWSDAAHFETKARNAADHGAIALVLMNPPLAKGSGAPMIFDRDFIGSAMPIPVLHIARPTGDPLIAKALGVDPKALQQQIDANLAPHSQELKDTAIAGRVALKRTPRRLRNVMAVVPGTGPHADEYVIVGGHYDHLGRGGIMSLLRGSKQIHHGADDNASGTAGVIELAREFAARAKAGNTPPRTILFVAFTAEEKGLIGSKYFVDHPPIPLDKVVAMLNLDMIGRLKAETLEVGGMGTAPSLERMLNDADKALPIRIKDIGKGGLGPSDHMSFALKKIPVLFFFTGLHMDYHLPTDTADKINFNGMAEIVQLSSRIIDAMAAMPREKYVTAADAHSMMSGMGDQGGGGRRVSLGVIPSYGEDPDVKGVRISGTSPDSPAAAAGLKDGDLLTAFNDKPMNNVGDLQQFLVAAKPGDTAKLRVMRDGKELYVQVTLVEKK